MSTDDKFSFKGLRYFLLLCFVLCYLFSSFFPNCVAGRRVGNCSIGIFMLQPATQVAGWILKTCKVCRGGDELYQAVIENIRPPLQIIHSRVRLGHNPGKRSWNKDHDICAVLFFQWRWWLMQVDASGGALLEGGGWCRLGMRFVLCYDKIDICILAK